MIGGIVGSQQEHHAAPYSITEEFVSVYRLHPLLPDDYAIRDHGTGALIEETELHPIQGHGTRPSIERYGMADLLYSFGVANPGAITLHNHPNALSDHVRLNGDRVDLGTIDILRDRERGVRRYNDFREKLRKRTDRALRGPHRQRCAGTRRSATSTTATSTGSTSRSACSASRCRPASGSATRRSGSSS